MENNKVWFVTGASKGLGLSLVNKLLKAGFKVAATSRNKQALTAATGVQSDLFLPLEMDLVNEQSVQEAIQQTISYFSTIDVVVNNAGYGQIGTLEELSDEESRKNFDTNVFGLLNVIRRVMPAFRKNNSGHIINISSVGGYYAGFAGWGIYCATKFAVAGLTESLAAESKAFGIKATVVYPGYFRTNFLSNESIMAPAHPIEAYEAARQSQAMHQNDLDGNQPGDPEKAADILIKIGMEKEPPLHLFLGEDAYNAANQKINEVQQDMNNWKTLGVATSFITNNDFKRDLQLN